MKPEETELLIAQVKKGIQPAITLLYEQQKSYWFRICLRYAKNRDEAQDVFQDGVAKIFEKIDTFNAKKGSFNAWSNKVLVHEVLRSLKKNQWQNSFSSVEGYEQEAYNQDQAIERISAKELTEVIQALPLGYRVVFNMYEIEGYSHKEIAEELNISTGTSKSQLSRAKKVLQNEIVKLFEIK
tara:strand:- start:135 stop:683 length:549 start_codon:yes stop_codon:yes gene_type:complete